MKTIIMFLLGLAAVSFAAMGCEPYFDELIDVVGAGDADGDTDGDTDADADIPDPPANVLLDCESNIAHTCAAVIEAGNGEDCIADFGWEDSNLGFTNQAGFKDNYNLGYVGFYGYNDVTPGAVQIPTPNYFAAEPSAEIESCDTNNDSALHFYASGFSGWGAGVGLDWGGEENPDCAVDGALDCLQLRIDDDHTPLAVAEASDVCQTNGAVDEAKINCFKYGKNINAPKDLSEYAGIGFWILATESNFKDKLKVAFPIPLSMRFYGEYYAEELGYGDVHCDEDDGLDGTKCYNDYALTIDLPVAGDSDVNRWIYHEVLFGEIATSTIFGVQPADDVGASYVNFPKTQSMGIKFQADTWQALMADTDFYIDDVTLLR